MSQKRPAAGVESCLQDSILTLAMSRAAAKRKQTDLLALEWHGGVTTKENRKENKK